jgi:hypothetical protein
MMKWRNIGWRAWPASAAIWVLGCGSGEAGPLSEPIEPPPQVEVLPEQPLEEMPADSSEPEPLPEEIIPPVEETPVEMPPPPEPEAGSGCRPARGVSGAPETISEAIVLLNTLPQPTTLACFLEALDRPLTLYMTSSNGSLQPSPGARSPRTFILRGDLEMSIVLDGSASNTLEFGFRREPTRSIKAEVLFPLTRAVSETSLFDRVQTTPRTTQCGACHVEEGHFDYPGFPLGVFESDVIAPFPFEEVSVESMRAEAATCDASAEPYRCGLLSALFDHGEVVQGVFREPE